MKTSVHAVGFTLSSLIFFNAHASTSVTLYGTIDTGIEYVNNIAKNADGSAGKSSSVHFTNITQSRPSLWGLRGSEDLGNGLNAIFALESGFNTATGISAQGGRLLGRQAWVGLKGDWGQLALGRQYNMLLWGLANVDMFAPNAYGLSALDSYLAAPRMDNAITYRGSVDGFQFGAAYARGRDNASSGGSAARGCGVDYHSSSKCSAYSFMLGFDGTHWGVAAAYDVMKGGDTTWTAGGLSNPADKDTRWTLNGFVKFDAWKLSLIYLNRKNTGGIFGNHSDFSAGGTVYDLGQRSDTYSINASYQMSPSVILDGSVNHIRYKDAIEKSNAWYYVARGRYAFSPRTSIYLQGAYIKNRGLSALSATAGTGPSPSPKLGGGQMAIMTGLQHSF